MRLGMPDGEGLIRVFEICHDIALVKYPPYILAGMVVHRLGKLKKTRLKPTGKFSTRRNMRVKSPREVNFSVLDLAITQNLTTSDALPFKEAKFVTTVKRGFQFLAIRFESKSWRLQ
ncbi:uncharacterized protein J3R85_008932 [Psidium guajava]|nr:uncharacterized protein J3R85_008932 [Psidium guajava]